MAHRQEGIRAGLRGCRASAIEPATPDPTPSCTTPPITFETREDAEALARRRAPPHQLRRWVAPRDRRAGRMMTLEAYAERWMSRRDLKPRTRAHYRSLLDRQILPHLGGRPLKSITSEDVRDWYTDLDGSRPTLRAHAYGLLRTIMQTAVVDEKIQANPCRIRSAGNDEAGPEHQAGDPV